MAEQLEKRNGAVIFRYTARVQENLGEKLKAEPWMHICFIKLKSGRVLYGIYIWDTRQVLAEGETDEATLNDKVYKHASYATDNHQYVKGSGEFSKQCNDMFSYNIKKEQAKRDAAKRRLEKRMREVPKTYKKFQISDENYTPIYDASTCGAVEASASDLYIDADTVSTIMPMLKSAFAEEVNAWYQYYIISPFLTGPERTSIVADYQENGNEELEHAGMLLERISQLGGDFSDIEALDKLDGLAKAKYIKPTTTDVKTSLQQIIDAEKGAIATYDALEQATRGKDTVTNRIAKTILADEQKHLQEAIDFMNDIK